jgi:tetratricopeptide (TPR) repeat protein
MRTGALSILLAAGVTLASAAHSQTPPASDSSYVVPSISSESNSGADPGWSDNWRWQNIPGRDRVNPIPVGVAALKANEFVLAEEMFTVVLRNRPNHADANFYMGVAGMNLGKWEDAKKHLEIAVRKKPKHPDPKSRLGVTYAKLGDTAGASAQRAELVKMADACKGTCRLSPYIAGGIQMIDEALAETSRGEG